MLMIGGNMKVKPLYDRVIILPDKKENVSQSGIILPETSQGRPQIGVVVAVGDGENFDGEQIGMKVSVEDTVLYNKYAGVELKLDGETYVILRQIDIIGVIE